MSRRFGPTQPAAHLDNGLPSDYEKLYPDTDELYHECDDKARLWNVYNDEAELFDKEMIAENGDALDITLIFSGLFSAVITTFVGLTSAGLVRDNPSVTVDLLLEISVLLRAQMNGTDASLIPSTNVTPPAETSLVWVNALWFVSLVLSMGTALFAVLAKQWIRQHMARITGLPHERAKIHQWRFRNLEAWRVRTIIGFLPTVLHASVLLFLAGLYMYLLPLHKVIALVVGALSLTIGVMYAFVLILPVFIRGCSYRIPFTRVLQSVVLLGLMAALVMIVAVACLLLPFIWLSQLVRSRSTNQPISGINWFSLDDGAEAISPDAKVGDHDGWGSLLGEKDEILDMITLGFRQWNDTERKRACVQTKQIIPSAIEWLTANTSNPSAHRIAVQALGSSPHISNHRKRRLCDMWFNAYGRFTGPALDEASFGKDEVLRQSERWLRASKRLEVDKWQFPLPKEIKATLDTSAIVEDRPLNLILSTFKAKKDDPPMTVTLAGNTTNNVPSFFLDNWQSLEVPLAPAFVWEDVFDDDSLPVIGVDVSDTFLDLVAHCQTSTATLAQRTDKTPTKGTRAIDPDVQVISFIEFLGPKLEKKGWFKDKRVIERNKTLNGEEAVKEPKEDKVDSKRAWWKPGRKTLPEVRDEEAAIGVVTKGHPSDPASGFATRTLPLDGGLHEPSPANTERVKKTPVES